ncbi:hypothetical protein ABFY48_00235 [Lysinibacillus pakistanensis]|uniref:hypothetical protein n=1 Tax=Lysinibacillus pakistanensis TaxID=759811 RepID=UPI003D2C1ACE
MMNLYESGLFFDEMLDGKQPKPHYRSFYQKLNAFSKAQLDEKYQQAQSSFLRQGITFTGLWSSRWNGAYNAL